MSHVAQNVIANLLARMWTALLGFAVVPIYLARLGVNGFGLVGFYMSLQSVLLLFDFGLSTTVNREMARLSAEPSSSHKASVLLRTLELPVWSLALLVLLIVWSVSGVVAEYWITSNKIPSGELRSLVHLMAVTVALQLPTATYSSTLLGLQKHVMNGMLQAFSASMRLGGAAFVLYACEPSLLVFFVWNALAAAVTVVIFMWAAWRQFPGGRWAAPSFGVFGKLWRFSSGVALFSVTAAIITQLDKLVLSSLVSIEKFGYYAVASQAAAGLYILSTPVYTAFFPAFSRAAAESPSVSLPSLYHLASQTLATIVIAPAALMIAFAPDLLLLWTHSAGVAAESSLPLGLLAFGTALSCVNSLPYGLQFAYGYTRWAVFFNVSAALLLIPCLFVACRALNGPGAALTWIGFNLAFMFIQVPVMHRQLLRRELRKWYLEDLGKPALIICMIVLLARLIIPVELHAVVKVGCLAAALGVALAAGVVVSDRVRRKALESLRTAYYRLSRTAVSLSML